MTMADLNGITRAQEESRESRLGALTGPQDELESHSESDPMVSAIVHPGRQTPLMNIIVCLIQGQMCW